MFLDLAQRPFASVSRFHYSRSPVEHRHIEELSRKKLRLLVTLAIPTTGNIGKGGFEHVVYIVQVTFTLTTISCKAFMAA